MPTSGVNRSVLLVGGHDTGKSNYLGRLWIALRRADGLVTAPDDPSEIDYVETLSRYLRGGEFAPRTDNDGIARKFETPLKVLVGQSVETGTLLVPDVGGELWEKASQDRELDADWLDQLEACDGALLFVRTDSKQNVPSLNWVTSARLMRAKATRLLKRLRDQVPTQLFLTDMVNLLEENLGSSTRARPRVAIIVTAWDALPAERRNADPLAYIRCEYPMLAGRLLDCDRIEVKVFGVSVAGGDLEKDLAHRSRFLASDVATQGSVVYCVGDVCKSSGDLTSPIAWALGADLSASG